MTLRTITFDCADAGRLARFWAEVMGWEVGPGANERFALVGDAGRPGMMFIQVPEGKTAKNRMHLDLASSDLQADLEHLLALGATRVHDKEEWGVAWTTLRDPEGNEFCIAAHRDETVRFVDVGLED
jgi:predicted enzyme related to lactoylglutathione lyase